MILFIAIKVNRLKMDHIGSLCHRDHQINILNFKSDAKVSYAIIVLKGTVNNSGSCKSKILVEHCHDGNTISKSKWAVHNSKFKILLQLRPQSNIITIHYCNKSITISIIYKTQGFSNVVTPVLIICDGSNGEIASPENYANSIESSYDRLALAIQIMQSFFAEKLNEKCDIRKTFDIEFENNTPKCIVYRSKLHVNEARTMTETQLWHYFGKELMTSIHGSQNRKFLAFLTNCKFTGCGNEFLTYDNIKCNTECYASVGKGNFALIGNAFLYTWPQKLHEVINRFEDSTPETFITRGRRSESVLKTVGGCYSLTLGAAIHELAHMFDLGHTQYGLMGREYIAVDKIFSFGRYDINPQAPYSSSKLLSCNINYKNIPCKTVFTTIKKPGSLSSMKEKSFADLDQYSVQILLCHKWFNNFTRNDLNSSLFKYDDSCHTLTAVNNIVIIQLRHLLNELVEYNFKLPIGSHDWIMEEKYCNTSWYLFAIDTFGNIFKFITRS